MAAAFDKDFVIQKIDTDRTVGGGEMLKGFRKGRPGGLPWFVILEPDGAEVASSNIMNKSGNVGCPYTEEEVEAFGGLLRKVCRQMRAEDIAAVLKVFHSQRKPKKPARPATSTP